nr:hypothetical protein pA40H1_p31 [Arthrobacter sp.]
MRDTETTTPLLSAYDWYSNPEDNEHALMCPECGETSGLHIDGVELENASGDRHRVDTVGEDRTSRFTVQQDGEAVHKGRRHQIA